ncbi:MAG TPA: STAS domain-containing protein, partial [Acidimicrobiales bacterium]|nr:STAS domain-containing protein [Acidimicrobiales bacterium]
MARVFAASIEMAGEMTDARPPFRDFDVFSDLSGESVLITVQGDVGRSNVREIAAALDEAMFFRQSAVVLDLAHMNSMDFGGVDVIASAASRLAGVGGQLTLRSPSAKVVKVFEIAGLTDRVLWDPPIAFERRQGLEESMQVAPVRVDTDNTGLLYGIREMTKVTAVPANLDVVEAALRIVTTLAQAAVVGADGVSISLRRHGQLATVAASDQTISDMDFDQYSTGEGPCIDASVKGHRLYSEYLDDEPRWPLFT